MPGTPGPKPARPPVIQCDLCGFTVRVGLQTFYYYVTRLRGRWHCFTCDPMNRWD